MNAGDDPFGYIGPSDETIHPSISPTVIVATPGQEYRIIVDDGSGRYASRAQPFPDGGYTSRSPSPDGGYTSRSPSPDGGYTSRSPDPDRRFPDEP